MGACSSSSKGGAHPKIIEDRFMDFASLQAGLRSSGLESCNLIVAVDFTGSNKWQGSRTFGGKNLHTIDPTGQTLNPYETALTIIARTLAPFDDDGLIPAIGFGCSQTRDSCVMSFNPDDAPCKGLPDVLSRYRSIIPYVTLAGPTSFAPAIRKAMSIVQRSGGQFHVLLIVADGQVSTLEDEGGKGKKRQLSAQERETIDAIVCASSLPLAIVVVGVGDGPWDMMEEFDDQLPTRRFDNFQFVPLNDVLDKGKRRAAAKVEATGGTLDLQVVSETSFAVAALQEIPEAYTAIQHMGLGSKAGRVSVRGVETIPPPPASMVPCPAPHVLSQGGIPRTTNMDGMAPPSFTALPPPLDMVSPGQVVFRVPPPPQHVPMAIPVALVTPTGVPVAVPAH